MIASPQRRPLGALGLNTTPNGLSPRSKGKLVDPLFKSPRSKPATTPRSKASKAKALSANKRPPAPAPEAEAPTAPPSPEIIEVFGETGVLKAERGPSPPVVEAFGQVGVLQAIRGPAPASAAAANDDASWDYWGDEEYWEWEGDDEYWEEEPTAVAPPALNTHIRFADSPARASDAHPTERVADGAGEQSAQAEEPAEERPKLSAKTMMRMGALARASRAETRAESALDQSAPSGHEDALVRAGPVPVLSARASVAMRQAREAVEAAAVHLADEMSAEEERRAELRAEELRQQMFAEEALHAQLLALPATPAARAAPPRQRQQRAPLVARAKIVCVAVQEMEAEEVSLKVSEAEQATAERAAAKRAQPSSKAKQSAKEEAAAAPPRRQSSRLKSQAPTESIPGQQPAGQGKNALW
jgi:hypothetical protein